MSSSKNDLYYLGNGWGWFVSIDYIDTIQHRQNNNTILPLHKAPKLETIKSINSINSIRSMKSVANLSDLQKDYKYNTNPENDEKDSMWGVNAICILSVVAFGFIII